MRQRFKARELWLFAPFLLIIAGALYWARVEQVSGPNGSLMHVSEVKVEAAPGYWQEKGMSHRVTVTISHPWPRPKWWGQHFYYRQIEGVLHPETARLSALVRDPIQAVATGESFTVVRDGKTVQLPTEYIGEYPDFEFDGTNYVSANYLNLSALPQSWGAVDIYGLYRIAGEPQLSLKRQIWESGGTLKVTPDKNPHAQLIKTTIEPFYILKSGNTLYDSCSINFFVRHFDVPVGQSADFRIYDVELHDKNGKIYRDVGSSIFGVTQFVPVVAEGTKLREDEDAKGLSISINRFFALTDDLKIKGKISADDHWPLSFEVKLPPRPAVMPPAK